MTTSDHDHQSRLPAGWRHGPFVRHLLELPLERRQSLQAAAFAVIAAVWAPLGVFAFLGHWLAVWAAVTALVAFALLTPVPTDVVRGAQSAAAALRSGATTVRGRLGPVVSDVREWVGPAAARAGARVGAMTVLLRRRAGELATRIGDTAGAAAQSIPRSAR